MADPLVLDGQHEAPREHHVRRVRAYVEAAARRIFERIASPEASRNGGLHKGAVAVGRLLHFGILDVSVVTDELVAAGVSLGLTRTESVRTVRSGMRYGSKRPQEMRASPCADDYLLRPPPKRPELVKARPRAAGVGPFWESCWPVLDDPEAVAWLESRRFPPGLVNELDACRVTPPWLRPKWGRVSKQAWNDTGHRLIFPGYDATGAIATVRARAIRAVPDDIPKCLPPRGAGEGSAGGAVLACPLAVQMLQGAVNPERLLFVEGETDFLRSRLADTGGAAIIGIWSGAFTPEIAARVPPGGEALIATDPDKAGDEYAKLVWALLSGRRRCRRVIIRGSTGVAP